MRAKFVASVVAILIASGWATAPAARARDQKEGEDLPPLPSVNATHFVVLASATGDAVEGVRLRIVMPVSGPKGPESWKQKTATIDGKDWRVIDMKGHPVDPKSLPNTLKKLTPVILALKEQPDPFHLRTTKEDCLIIIGPKDAIQNLEEPDK